MKKLLVAVCVVGCAVASAFGWTVAKVSNAYRATDESTGLVLNISVLSSANHTIRFDSVRENLNGVTVLDLTGGFVEEGGTEWTLTQIAGSACGQGTAPIKAILTEVRLPETLEQINDNAFAGCPNLTKVTPFLPASVKVIQTKAFYKSPVGGDLKLSNTNLTVVGLGCFNCEGGVVCGNLRSVDFTGSGVTEIGGYAFMNATNLTDVILPGTLAKIGIQAFNNCINLTNVTPLLPPTVTSIGASAFYMAPVDGDLVLSNPGLTTIESSTFGQTANIAKTIGRLQSVDFTGSGVTQIKSSAFRFQPRLERVVLPDALTTLGNAAFKYCTNLTAVTPFFPASLTSIGEGVFSLVPVEGDCVLSNPELTAFPNSVFSQPENMSQNNGRLRSIDFTGSGVTTIGGYVAQYQKHLERVTLPAKLEKIGTDAFYSCPALTNVTPILPKSCYSLGGRCFAGAPIVGDFVVANKDMVSIGGNVFQSSKFTTIDLRKTSITSLGGYAFSSNPNLTKVVFPKTLSTFDKYVFYSTPNLQQVYFSNDFGVPPLPGASLFTGVEKNKWLKIYVPVDTPNWNGYLNTYGRVLTDAEVEEFKTKYPGEKLPIGLVPYPSSDSRFLAYLFHWNPDPGFVLTVR